MDPHERIAELEAQVAYLKGELGYRADDDSRLARLQRAFRLTPARARLLLKLYEANGEVVPHGALLRAASKYPDYTGSEVVKVQIHHLRASFGRRYIETLSGRGYYLTPEGITLVRAALEPKAEAAA